jgi:amino acid transporter
VFSPHSNQTVPLLSKWYFRAVSIFMLFDIGLSVGGYVTMAGRTDNVLIPTGWTIASSVVVAFVYCYTVGLFVYFWLRRSRNIYGPEERRLLLAPAICTLPLLVRHIEPLIFVGTSDLFWNQVVGNGFVYLFMILLPEVIIIAVSIWCIRGVEPLPKERKNAGERHLELSSSASRGEPPSAQEPPERHQLRRRQTP